MYEASKHDKHDTCYTAIKIPWARMNKLAGNLYSAVHEVVLFTNIEKPVKFTFVNIKHELVKVDASFPRNAAGIVKQVHKHRLSTADATIQIQALR